MDDTYSYEERMTRFNWIFDTLLSEYNMRSDQTAWHIYYALVDAGEVLPKTCDTQTALAFIGKGMHILRQTL